MRDLFAEMVEGFRALVGLRATPPRPRRKFDSPEQEAIFRRVLEKRREALRRLAEGGPDGGPSIQYDSDNNDMS